MNYFQQVNYLIDEAVNTGKGANLIISMVHHFLATHNLGEAYMQTTVRAKTRTGTSCAWRVLSGLNKEITLSFLIVGHTKFLVFRAF